MMRASTSRKSCSGAWVILLLIVAAPTWAQVTSSRTETITYEDNPTKWVMGQVKTVTCQSSTQERCVGNVIAAATYDTTTANQLTFSSFGALRQTLTYNANGTVATVKDGNNQTTTLSDWYRGTPRTIQYPGGATQSAEVNAQGWLTSVTDENGYKTCYAYDQMGRISGVWYPSESVLGACDGSPTQAHTVWAPTSQVFERVTVAEYGIPAGHWRQTISTGNARKISYFDGQWRPVVTREYDDANVAGTQRFMRFAYDHEGRTTFASYPGTTDALTTGTWTDYDALGRVESVAQDSELGLLTTLTAYETGFKTRVTDPKSNQTTTSFLTFDQPSTDWPTAIEHPGGAYTDIGRDAHGKPLSIARRNAGSSLNITRTYAYNSREELCRSQEPETNATLLGYDGAGNLKWSAAGLAQGTNCEDLGTSGAVAARRVDRTYDGRNRLLTLAFPNGAGNQTWTYTPDGLPSSVSATNPNIVAAAVTQYIYNRRRMLTQESLNPTGGGFWPVIYAYNGSGHLSALTYPTGLSVGYAPNALGQPTQAGSYASGVQYYPNGAIKQFTYGNGIVHTMTQNARQLPSRTTSCTAAGTCATADKRLDLGYAFDANGNVANITDHVDGRQTRGMSYDGLDRLTQVTSNMFGTASYAYDVLDNLTQVTVTGGDKARAHHYCYDSNWRLSFVRLSGCPGGAAAVALGYDVQGNLSYKNNQNYNFDFGNRLREVVGKEWYAYDGHGRRVVSCNSTQCSIQQYGLSGEILYAHDDRTNKRVEHIYLAGSLIALRERPTSTEVVTVKYQHTDALGTPAAVTDAAMAFMNKYEYEPYGQLVNSVPLDGPGYTGHVQDAATGLTYMQQRYYDPQIGLFLSVDPVTAFSNSAEQFHRYRYANNNPYLYSDPDGRAAECTGSRVSCPTNTQGAPQNDRVSRKISGANLVGNVNVPGGRPDISMGQPDQPLFCAGGADCDFMYNQNEYLNDRISRDEFLDRTQTQGTGGVVGAGIVVTSYTVAKGGPVLVAGGVAGAKYVLKNSKFHGPSRGLMYANGTVMGWSWRSANFNIRLDYAPIPGSKGVPVLHVNYGNSGRGKAPHIVIWDPRWYSPNPMK